MALYRQCLERDNGMSNSNSKNITKESLQPVLESAHRALKDIRDCAADAKACHDSLVKEIEGCRVLVQNASRTLGFQREEIQRQLSQRIDSLLRTGQDKIDAHEAKLTELIGKATIGLLSSRYGEKAREERVAGRWFLICFYLTLLLAIVAGGCIVSYSWSQLPQSIVFWTAIKTILIRFAACMPIYIPLFWLAAHLNRWAALKNRLAEEYDHKKLVVETYIGLADKIDELVKKGVKTAPDLVSVQLEKTVEAVCFDACTVLDKIKVHSPVGEITKGVSNVMTSVSGGAKDRPRHE